MHELYELREKLCHELKKYGKEDITSNSLEVVDSLSHAIKNIDKIIERNEEEEMGSYNYDRNYKGYSRGRGRNAKRDSMGRYAKTSDIVSGLRDLMMDAPDEQTRQEYQRVISKIEMM